MQRLIFMAIVSLSLLTLPSSGAYCYDMTEAEKEEFLSEYRFELERLNAEIDEEISRIGPVEFSSLSELSDIENVASFKENLKKYWETKRDYFERLDDLLRRYRKKMGHRSEELGARAHRLFKRLEKRYVADLSDFYTLVLRNHKKMDFEEGQIYLEDERDAIELNTLWARAVRSTRALMAALN